MSKYSATALNENGLVLCGYQKKLKTMKKKFFVLYKETLCGEARLEYYDNEKKFKSGLAPKRMIKLKHCFNINRRLDTKYKNVISLSTRDGGFGIVMETEQDMHKWLDVLIDLQRCDDNISNDNSFKFDHVWQVLVQKKGLAEEKGIVGNYHICLSKKSVTFIRIGQDKTFSGDCRTNNIEIPLTAIRRCGDSQCIFYMEVGRQSTIGPGELWMETEDSLIAQHMHSMISSAMSAKNDSNHEPMRKRSSSATEASKPINVLQKRQAQSESKAYNSPQTSGISYGRERCDSLPSRNRTSSECSNQSFMPSSALTIRTNSISGHRPNSYQRHSNSPPVSCTMGYSESEESSISMDEPDDNGSFLSYRFNSRSSEGVIPEENADELMTSESKSNEINITGAIIDNCSLKTPDVAEENYISMVPTKVQDDIKEIKKLKSLMYAKSTEDEKYMHYPNSNDVPTSEIQFSEYTSDNITKSIDLDPQCERPTRTYSIGSKVEHNKFTKKMGFTNEADQSTTRVRAFSVGSRARIPRCDLQRAILFPKSMIEQNSNNNVCSVTDVNAYNQLMQINSNRDKKSTSAPLLTHKSHNSVDRMSDLMEIDFSKIPHNTNTNMNTGNRAHMKGKPQFSKSATNAVRDQMRKLDVSVKMLNNDEGSFQKLPSIQSVPSITTTKSISETDNGYLEMKPVGSGSIKSKNLSTTPFSSVSANTSSNEHLLNKPKIFNASDITENKNATNIMNTATETVTATAITTSSTTITTNTNTNTNTNSSVLPSKCYNIDLNEGNITQCNKTLATHHDNVLLGHKNNFEIKNKTIQKNTLNTENLDNKLLNNSSEVVSVYNASDMASNSSYNISPQLTSLTLKPKLINENYNEDDYVNIEKKYDPSSNKENATQQQQLQQQKSQCFDNINLVQHQNLTNEDSNVQKSDKNRIQCGNETGYEILQIKSDSSLQSYKSTHRPNSIRKEKQIQLSSTQNRPRSTNSSSFVSSSSSSSSSPSSFTLSACTSSSTSCLNYSPIVNTVNTATTAAVRDSNNASNSLIKLCSNSNINNISNTLDTKADKNSSSRPPSVSSEHELYYAKLDLPQPSTDNCVKMNKSSCETSTIAISSANNLYAKIDFDHSSDSSSSSSKNLNI